MHLPSIVATDGKQLLSRANEQIYRIFTAAEYRKGSSPDPLSDVLEWLSWDIAAETGQPITRRVSPLQQTRRYFANRTLVQRSHRVIGHADASGRDQR